MRSEPVFISMIRTLVCFAFINLCVCGSAQGDDRSISTLESRASAIESELSGLAHPSLRGGVGAIGFHSRPFLKGDKPLWVEIDLGSEQLIDQIVLVPVLWRDMEKGFRADAFPSAFRVVAGTAQDQEGKIVAEYEQSAETSNSISPVLLPIEPTRASWVRLEVLGMSKRIHDDRYVFQLSEIMVFSGMRNVALRQPIDLSFRKPPDPSGAWARRFLVDGTVPYLMDAVSGSKSLGYLSRFGESPHLNIDLGAAYSISEIRLHAVEQSSNVPQAYLGDLGIPRHMRIEGANAADFSDAIVLLDYRAERISDTGPIMMWNVPDLNCRYVRLVTIEQNVSFGVSERLSRVGFSEIELISAGQNVAFGKKAWVDSTLELYRSPAELTDGLNSYGEILPIRRWMEELALRHDLEIEREHLEVALNTKYVRQKVILVWMQWMVVASIVGSGFVILYSRIRSIRKETNIRERIAANLHDELGANLHSIGMLSDLAQESIATPEPLSEILQKIRGLTERTGAAARYCSNMLEAKGICEDLVDDMRREARRLLADIPYEMEFEDEQALNALKRRKRIDLYLFFKESLVNTIRHGQATSVQIFLCSDQKEIRLRVTDNGCGFAGGLPHSLRRRARLMRARAEAEHPDGGGTVIHLKLKV